MSAPRATQLVEAGLWLRLSGDHEGARRLFEQAIKLDPTNARARQLLEAGPPGSAPARSEPAQPPVPGPEAHSAGPANPFERLPSEGTSAGDLDWGLATGFEQVEPERPEPPVPSPPGVPSSATMVFGAPPPVPGAPPPAGAFSSNVQLGGEAPVPRSSTLVFGLNQASTASFDPFADASSEQTDPSTPEVKPPGPTAPFYPFDVDPRGGAPGPGDQAAHHTLSFGAQGPQALPNSPGPADEPSHGTMVFGGLKRPEPPLPGGDAPAVGDEPLHSTMVFGGLKHPVSPPPPAGGPALGDEPPRGTLVFGLKAMPSPGEVPAPVGSPEVASAVPSSSTMVFGGGPVPSIQPVVSSGTMVFGGGVPPPPPPGAAPPGGTMVFGAPSPPPGAAPPGGTMVFAAPSASPFPSAFAPAPAVPAPVASSGTMMFSAPSVAPVAPPAAPAPVASSPTMMFSSPPPQAPVGPPPVAPVPRPPPSAPPPFAALSSVTMSFNPPPAPPSPVAPAFELPDDASTGCDTRSNPGIDLSRASGAGVGFDLISSEPPPPPRPRSPAQLKDEVGTLLRGAKDLLGLDDHTGAMDLMLKALELDPGNAEVLKLKERSEQTLETMYESKLGNLGATPRVKLKDDEVIWLNLDHRAGFVLAQIDGSVTFEDVFAVSGMSRLDTARILAQLVEEGVISRG